MTEKDGEVAGIFVQGTGTAKAIVAGAALGASGALAYGTSRMTSPLATRQLGYLSVGPGEITLYGAKRKVMLGGFKATDDVVTTVPRGSVAGAAFEKGTVVGHLAVGFTDETGWSFEVPRVGNKTVDEAVAAMNAG